MSDSAIKTEIVRFVTSFYSEHGNVPSVGSIIKQFNLSRTQFYGLFPAKLSELCRLAGVPIPENRIQAVKQALNTRTVSKQKEALASQQLIPQCLILSSEETRRVLGICQLEGGIEPSLVIDRLLNLDTELRRRHRLTLSKANAVSCFLDSAVARGWRPTWIVEYITRLWNSRILNLNEVTLRNLISLAQGIDLRFWGSVETFIQYATRHYNRIGNYRNYLAGTVSLEQLVEAEGLKS